MSREKPNKPVVLVIIDALATRVVIPAMKAGRLPTLSALAQRGVLREESTAIFPSITPAATSTIVTGAYPVGHNIMGFHWYDEESEEEVYYGDDFWVVARQGFGEFFRDCVSRLNNSRMKAETIFQQVEQAGGRSASLNFLMFHADQPHTAKIPSWFSWLPGVEREHQVSGPQILFFGDMINNPEDLEKNDLTREGGLLGRFGFNDSNTKELLHALTDEKELPHFSIAYFPDNDYESHAKGPADALEQVIEVDTALGTFFEKMGGLEAGLEKLCIVISGDHSQTDMDDDKERATIRLDKILADFSVSEAGIWETGKDLKICPDMRCAQIYSRDKDDAFLAKLTRVIHTEERVDQVLRKAGEHVVVSTSDRGVLSFWRGEDGDEHGRDLYGNPWSWQGPLDPVGGRCDEGRLVFDLYPNAFERIWGCLDNPSGGDLWLTCHPGSEFAIAETSVHVGGGSHGSLHKDDSTSPVIIAGHRSDLTIPDYPRTVDLTPLCLEQMGLSGLAPGAGRYT